MVVKRGDEFLKDHKVKLVEGDIVVIPDHIKPMKIKTKVTKAFRKLRQEQVGEFKQMIEHETKDFILLNKKAGVPSQGGHKIKKSLDKMLEYYLFLNGKKDESPHLIHRLDRDASGAMVMGKNRQYAERMSERLRESGKLEKTYKAITASMKPPNAVLGEMFEIQSDLDFEHVIINGDEHVAEMITEVELVS